MESAKLTLVSCLDEILGVGKYTWTYSDSTNLFLVTCGEKVARFQVNNMLRLTRDEICEFIIATLVEPTCPIEAAPGQVVLKVLEGKAYNGSIALPDSAKTESDFCEVMSIGRSEWTDFCIGDIVLRPDPAEVEYMDEDTNVTYLIVPESSIVAWKAGGRNNGSTQKS